MSTYHLSEQVERPPATKGEPKLSDGRVIRPPDGEPWTDDLLELVGMARVRTTARPADTDTATHDRTVVVADGVPTETWTARPWTADEQATRSRNAAHNDREQKLKASVAWLRSEASKAAAHTVTTGNHLGTTQAVVGNLAKFYAGFADMLENDYGPQP